MSMDKLVAKRVLRPARSMSKGNERWFEFYRTTCPICSHQGWCMVNESKIICGRVASDKKLGDAGYLHELKENQKRGYEFSPDRMIKEHNKKKDYTLDVMYSLFLESLEVRDEHTEMLTGPKRQISKESIRIRNYKSFPLKPWKSTKQLIEKAGGKTSFVEGIPGFYAKKTEKGRYFTFAGRKDSLLIPQRNIYNQICGFQCRIDKPKYIPIVRNIKPGFKVVVIEQPNIIKAVYENQDKVETIFQGEVEVKEWYELSYKGDKIGEAQLKKVNMYG